MVTTGREASRIRVSDSLGAEVILSARSGRGRMRMVAVALARAGGVNDRSTAQPRSSNHARFSHEIER